MAEQSELQLALSLETDNSIAQAAKELDKVADSADSLSSALKKIEREKALDKLAQDASDAAKAGAKTEAVIESLNAELKKVGANDKEIEKVIRQFEKLRNTVDKVDPNEGFDRVSRNVSLGGDVESNLRTVGGAVGAFGGGGAERVIGGAAEIPALIEAIPRLKEAAAGLPQTISAAGAALGTSGAGFIGALGISAIAIGAVAIAFKKFSDDAKKQAEELNAVIDARRDVAQDIAGGLGSEDAKARLDEINASRQAEADLLAQLKTQYDGNVSSQNALLETVIRLTPQEQALVDQIKQSEASIQSYNTEQQALQIALEDGTLAANDAAQAERELAAERTQSILTEAAQAGELEATRQRFNESTREQIALEQENIAARKISLETELAALQASGDTSEQVTERIASLTETISFLGEQSAALDTLRAGAKTDEQVAREKALQSARTETARATDKAYQSELAKAKGEQETATRNRTSERASTPRRTATARSSTPSTKDTGSDGIIENLRRIENDIIKVQNEAEKQRIDQVINNNRRLQDIARDFGDTRADALEEGNFLSLEAVNKEEQRAKRDQRIENKRANDNIKRDSKRSLDELSNEQSKYENQRLQMTQQANQRMISLHGQFLQAQVNQISAAFRAISGYTAGRSVSESQARQRGLISNAASRPVTP